MTPTVFFYPQGATLLMMGSADELPPVPVEKPVFMEDMSDAQLATAVRKTFTNNHRAQFDIYTCIDSEISIPREFMSMTHVKPKAGLLLLAIMLVLIFDLFTPIKNS